MLAIFAPQYLEMKINKSVLYVFLLLIIVGAFFRVIGFAPQIAMAVFGGAVVKDKRLAFVLPLFSMLISDLLYELLFVYGYTEYGGFYAGQFTNYILLALITMVGFAVRKISWARVLLASVAATTLYFLLSNFFVWQGGGGLGRPHTLAGLVMCYADALPFYRTALVHTTFFSFLLFGCYFLIERFYLQPRQIA